jgi:hypothetical protein
MNCDYCNKCIEYEKKIRPIIFEWCKSSSNTSEEKINKRTISKMLKIGVGKLSIEEYCCGITDELYKGSIIEEAFNYEINNKCENGCKKKTPPATYSFPLFYF